PCTKVRLVLANVNPRMWFVCAGCRRAADFNEVAFTFFIALACDQDRLVYDTALRKFGPVSGRHPCRAASSIPVLLLTLPYLHERNCVRPYTSDPLQYPLFH